MTRLPMQVDPLVAIVLGLRMFAALVWFSIARQMMRAVMRLLKR